jgi:hypothetical protein
MPKSHCKAPIWLTIIIGTSMNLSEEYRNYKLSVINDRSRHFFHYEHCQQFEQTHTNINKPRNIKKNRI